MTITVHHLNYSRSLGVLWMLEELELDYNIKPWARDKAFRAPQQAQRIHALGRFPMVEVDGHVLVESGAILEYFAHRQGKLWPSTDKDALQARQFLHYAEGSVMPPLLVQLILDKVHEAPMPFFAKPIAKAIVSQIGRSYSKPAIELHFNFIDGVLAKQPYFAGQALSIADIQMLYPVEAGLRRGADHVPNIRGWLERVRAREPFKRAETKGGPAMPPTR